MWDVQTREINIERVSRTFYQSQNRYFYFKLNSMQVQTTVYQACVYALAHPSQSMISGPSNEKGSEASGSDFIL